MTAIDPARIEALGPAERILQTLTTFTDHLYHGRPGMVSLDARTRIGCRWEPVIYKAENNEQVVYRLVKQDKRTEHAWAGVLMNRTVYNGARVVGEYRKPGLYPEVAAYLYRQVAEVFRLDNEFAARWASHAFSREYRDIKVILAAFMLVQNRVGEPVREDGKVVFLDDDYRAVGEAVCLLPGQYYVTARDLLRIGDVLQTPGVVAINRELGFGRSGREAPLGRYRKAVEKWLRYREDNPPVLQGLVKSGWRRSVMQLARRVGYKPTTPRFFETLRWKQKQAPDGRREMAIGVAVAQAESWQGLSEVDICRRIIETRPSWQRLVGLLPSEVGLTRAVVAAALKAESISDATLIILTPTLEDLGLLKIPEVEIRWRAALAQAENQRAANIAQRVKHSETAKRLQESADRAVQVAVEKVARGLRIYICVDKSGSMEAAIDRAKEHLTKFVHAFPLDRLHVSVFNTVGVEVMVKTASAAGVTQAFRGHTAGGGTVYGSGVKALAQYKPTENEDLLIVFVGDQEGEGGSGLANTIREAKLNPVALGLLDVGHGRGHTVTDAATELHIPCLEIEEALFSDPYAVARALQNLVAATPVGQTSEGTPRRGRKTLVEEILQTPLLQKPVWA